jgi:AcrR family transcriptional regulator
MVPVDGVIEGNPWRDPARVEAVMDQTDVQTNGVAPSPPAETPTQTRRRRGARTRNGLTPEQRRRQRRQALVDAGLELFGSKGYNSTSVEEICRTAYVSTRNFYEEFENREALLWNLVYQTMAEAYDALRQTGPDPQAQPGPTHLSPELRGRISRMVHAFVDDPRRARLVFVECRGMSLLQEYRRRAAQQAFAQLLGEILEERGAYIAVSTKARGTYSLAIVGAVDLILSDWVLQPERPTVPDLIDSLTEVVGWMGSAAVTKPPAGP